MEYTEARHPINRDQTIITFADGRSAVIGRTHRQNGFGPRARRSRREGWSTVVTDQGRVVDSLFETNRDRLIERIAAGENRKG